MLYSSDPGRSGNVNDISKRYIEYGQPVSHRQRGVSARPTALAASEGVVDNSRTLSKIERQHPIGHAGGAGRVDYSLARRATLRAVQAGRVSRLEVCDAHPDLLRAARFCGTRTTEACPVCDHGPLVLVSYVFSDELPARENGRVWAEREITPLLQMREVRLYTVEVCPDCSWNHLRSQLMMQNGKGRRPGRMSARRRGRAST